MEGVKNTFSNAVDSQEWAHLTMSLFCVLFFVLLFDPGGVHGYSSFIFVGVCYSGGFLLFDGFCLFLFVSFNIYIYIIIFKKKKQIMFLQSTFDKDGSIERKLAISLMRFFFFGY